VANVLPRERQIEVLNHLVEGNTLRSTARLTGLDRTTIMKLLVRFGKACQRSMDRTFQDLMLGHLEVADPLPRPEWPARSAPSDDRHDGRGHRSAVVIQGFVRRRDGRLTGFSVTPEKSGPKCTTALAGRWVDATA
jgi:hypothetical protein